jgi:hypothetical protein
MELAMPENSYSQFCPVAMAAEVLGVRWTLLLLRELVSGSTRFNDLRQPGQEVDLCSVDPGFDVDLYLSTDVRHLTSRRTLRVFREEAFRTWRAATAA